MQAISGSVGELGLNAKTDVALVQAILMKTQRSSAVGRAAAPYLQRYDGAYGATTKIAIQAFQDDYVFNLVPTRNVAPINTSKGLIKPGDLTWQTLTAQVPPEWSDLSAIPGGTVVYVAATNDEF
jgi:hypothetical protein